VARFIGVKIAGGLYHEWSGFIFFPIAIFSMMGVSDLLNRDWSGWLKPETLPARGPAPAAPVAAAPAAPAKATPVSYDY
jgi:hypothetical protein